MAKNVNLDVVIAPLPGYLETLNQIAEEGLHTDSSQTQARDWGQQPFKFARI